MSYIEHDFPIEGLNKIAHKEASVKKPVYRCTSGERDDWAASRMPDERLQWRVINLL